jgi:Glu-tRNA(Gln) amidotransferase subunit E-like FAD-binding protein
VGGDPLGDRVLIFAQSCGSTSQRSQSTGTELVEPVRQRCGIPGIEHGGELTDKVVGAAELRAVLE